MVQATYYISLFKRKSKREALSDRLMVWVSQLNQDLLRVTSACSLLHMFIKILFCATGSKLQWKSSSNENLMHSLHEHCINQPHLKTTSWLGIMKYESTPVIEICSHHWHNGTAPCWKVHNN